ncbi:MAG: von Willebrand factor type A domain-containing protein [Oscillospiraceae bacterium]|nr:von Willebrand factor type A domain-containing protein [Oscillospiraceae bacterium]
MKQWLRGTRKATALGLAGALALALAGCGSNAPSATEFGRYPTAAPNYEAPGVAQGDEEYLSIAENSVRQVEDSPLITFSLKVDTASYRNVARYLESGALPPADAVRVEEMINYFNYDKALPENDTPFSLYAELGDSPFSPGQKIAFVRVKSRDIDREDLPPSHLTFLIDTSGSMDSYDKLPLLQAAFTMLTETLTEADTVSLVTYAGRSAVLLDSVSGGDRGRILEAIYNLEAGGSTAGAGGIQTAYELAEKNFDPGANNRVLLATDGDFNVGLSSVAALERLIADKRASGIYLTVLGFGTENLKDNKMETLAKNGNGNYSYIDSLAGAEKVLVSELGANLYTVADDVKAQVEFNPARVSSYRLIGYENRMLADQDFYDDRADAGEIGAGADVALLFEFTPTGSDLPLRYQERDPSPSGDYADEFFQVKIRYQEPGQSASRQIDLPVKTDSLPDFNSSDFNFAVSVAGFGLLLRDSAYRGDVTAEALLGLARENLGADKGGYRREFVTLVERYQRLVG